MATILIIDDSASILALTAHYLQTAGHTVLTTSSGRRAFEMLDQQPVDLVLTDIYMPEPDGLEILTKARDKKLTVPFVAMSSQQGETNFFKLAKALGAVATLQKPFTAPQLNAVVAEVLRKRKAGARVSMAPSATALGNEIHGRPHLAEKTNDQVLPQQPRTFAFKK
jgi:DNA-binding NtrC family response regulator